MITKNVLKELILVASKQMKPDLILRNGRIVDVFNLTIIRGDVAIHKGYFVGIGEYEGDHVIDIKGKYMCPSFIDSHVHVESSMVTPYEFIKVLLKNGVTSVVSDPHEIASVVGTVGLDYMLHETKNLPFDYHLMLPSSVMSTKFESSGAVLGVNDLAPYMNYDRVLGLGEEMYYKKVVNLDEDLLDKIILTLSHNKVVDGHAAGFNETAINTYLSAQITTDHETVSAKGAITRLDRGMYLQIRQGTGSKDLKSILPVINRSNLWRSMFCTDDKHLEDLVQNGSVNHSVKIAIHEGMPAIMAIGLATITASECYGLKNRGAIAPGYQADFLLLDDLEQLDITHVYKSGNLIVKHGELISYPRPKEHKAFKHYNKIINTFDMKEIDKRDLKLEIREDCRANIIEVIPNSLYTRWLIEEVKVMNGQFVPSVKEDHLKIAVINRYGKKEEIGVGIIKGFKIKEGAIGTSISHDAHNVLIVGTNDLDMIVAANKIKDMQGGLVAVNDGKVLESLPLRVAGLMSDQSYQEVYKELVNIQKIVRHELGFSGNFSAFLTLSFMSLPVIPEIKITTKGLVNVNEQKLIPICD
ncbi:adenine deaminase [Haloplasma contractile]|uniref:Adenine deaminase n=1 Tax=Haloplasma contractile SSD-17B TaxID=1033810 RepID=F7PUB5_9MOLU|nr:adenine deaminase [Haloplasma contractile]ERJ11699.1 Adenine deaminase protein [Haloplasma contractile SSD-17B]